VSPILKLEEDDEERELEFELAYLLSLTTQERFELMFRKSREMAEQLLKHGHRKPVEIAKRTDDLIQMKQAAGRPKDLEDLRALTRLKQERR